MLAKKRHKNLLNIISESEKIKAKSLLNEEKFFVILRVYTKERRKIIRCKQRHFYQNISGASGEQKSNILSGSEGPRLDAPR